MNPSMLWDCPQQRLRNPLHPMLPPLPPRASPSRMLRPTEPVLESAPPPLLPGPPPVWAAHPHTHPLGGVPLALLTLSLPPAVQPPLLPKHVGLTLASGPRPLANLSAPRPQGPQAPGTGRHPAGERATTPRVPGQTRRERVQGRRTPLCHRQGHKEHTAGRPHRKRLGGPGAGARAALRITGWHSRAPQQPGGGATVHRALGEKQQSWRGGLCPEGAWPRARPGAHRQRPTCPAQAGGRADSPSGLVRLSQSQASTMRVKERCGYRGACQGPPGEQGPAGHSPAPRPHPPRAPSQRPRCALHPPALSSGKQPLATSQQTPRPPTGRKGAAPPVSQARGA